MNVSSEREQVGVVDLVVANLHESMSCSKLTVRPGFVYSTRDS